MGAVQLPGDPRGGSRPDGIGHVGHVGADERGTGLAVVQDDGPNVHLLVVVSARRGVGRIHGRCDVDPGGPHTQAAPTRERVGVIAGGRRRRACRTGKNQRE